MNFLLQLWHFILNTFHFVYNLEQFALKSVTFSCNMEAQKPLYGLLLNDSQSNYSRYPASCDNLNAELKMHSFVFLQRHLGLRLYHIPSIPLLSHLNTRANMHICTVRLYTAKAPHNCLLLALVLAEQMAAFLHHMASTQEMRGGL